MSFASIGIRILFGKGDRKRDKGLKTPCDIQRFDNLKYGPRGKWNLLDLYVPKNRPEGKLPVIVSFHGGAWVYGTKEVYQYYGMSLAQRGFAFVNFNYGLAPKFKFPQPLEDMNLVMKWVLENAEKYGLDADNIFAVGDSAGGNGLGLYAEILTNSEYASKFKFKAPEGLRLKGIALNCGEYRISEKDLQEKLSQRIMKDYFGGKVTLDTTKIIDVTRSVTKDFPPTFLMTCLGDFLKEQAPLMEQQFKEKGIRHEYKIYGTEENPLSHVFHVNVRLPEAAVCNDDECNFFRSLM